MDEMEETLFLKRFYDLNETLTIFAGPKGGRPITGFSIFIRTYVRPSVRMSVRPYVSEIKSWSLHIH